MALPCPLKNESTEPQMMFCFKTDGKLPPTKPQVKRVKKSKSRELRAGILYIGCDCERRYGLQDDCLRSDCHGAPPCLVKPDPICGPSEFAGGKHLMKKLEDRKNALNNPANISGYECVPITLKICSAETECA